jgi:hypothetical protein
MSQQKQLTECRKCSEKGILRKYIDFEKLGEGNWLLKDHGTDNPHVHRKLCNDCNIPIYYDRQEGRFRDDLDTRLHNCRESPEYYRELKIKMEQQLENEPVSQSINTIESPNKAVAITHSEGKLGDELVGLTIPPEEETNPIKQKLDSPKELTGEYGKRIELIWTLLKSINEKMDGIKKVEENYKTLIDVFNKYFLKTDKVIAELAEVKIRRANGKPLERESEQPTDEEISNMMEKEAEDDIPTDDDDVPEDK